MLHIPIQRTWFCSSQRIDLQDLKYDTMGFVRKLECMGYFKENPELKCNGPSSKIHNDIRVPSFSHPMFANPVLDDIKTKLYGWIANHESKAPKANLTPLEMRGRRWLLDNIKNETLFITKADKGGSILILNYCDVRTSIENELFNEDKFVKLDRNADEQLSYVKNELKSLVIHCEEKKLITDKI